MKSDLLTLAVPNQTRIFAADLANWLATLLCRHLDRPDHRRLEADDMIRLLALALAGGAL